MPIYEYRCEECAQVFEEWQNDFEERDAPCPVCGAHSKRLISHSAFILKGSGWYATDYSRKSSSENGNGNGKKDKSEAAAGESAPSSKDSSKEGAKSGSGEGSGAKNKSDSSQAGAAQ